ncbi:MAG: RNA polymerase sigma-70 factor (ECF subfamily) [Planctomycetota bacterium]|jgi:RNA polymerase sigma-70 factor (ECF subfamily)
MKNGNQQAGSEQWTLLLRELASGRQPSQPHAVPQLVAELKAIARGQVRHLPVDHSLLASALVNEAYLKLFGGKTVTVADRPHFFALAAKAMRQVLVDHARKTRASKRDAQQTSLSLSLADPMSQQADVDVVDLHEALEQLAAVDKRQGRIVELRYFGGLTVDEVGEVIGASVSTVEREWRFARAWLARRLAAGEPS